MWFLELVKFCSWCDGGVCLWAVKGFSLAVLWKVVMAMSVSQHPIDRLLLIYTLRGSLWFSSSWTWCDRLVEDGEWQSWVLLRVMTSSWPDDQVM